jgi:ribosome-associated protein
MPVEEKSKSRIKREMLALQALGERLVALSPALLDKLALPEPLRGAILLAKGLKKHEARRRQMQYIGVLMREVDPEPLQQALTELGQGKSLDAAILHQAEAWREQLLDGDVDVIEEILERFSHAERQYLRQLVRNGQKERLEDRNERKAARALFRYLRDLLEDLGTTGPH